jgi:uncharacterized protein (TIGR00730 family)
LRFGYPCGPALHGTGLQVGKTLALRGIGVVYGGASGPDGGGGRRGAGKRRPVIGVIPTALAKTEVANHCTELHVVDDMHQRKAAFTRLSDGFITLPGGVGTMDELWEAVSWSQLGYHAKPVGVLNAFGFYDQLLAFNRHMIEVGFIRPAHQGIIIAEREMDLLLDRMAAHEPITPIVQMDPDTL